MLTQARTSFERQRCKDHTETPPILPVVHMHEVDPVPSSGLKFVFDAVLKAFPFDLHSGEYQAVTDKMARITDALVGAKAVEIWFLLLDIDAGYWVESYPSGEGPSALVGPSFKGRQRNRLVVFVRFVSLLPREGEKLLRSLALGELPDRVGERRGG